jgi:hypothetical protein
MQAVIRDSARRFAWGVLAIGVSAWLYGCSARGYAAQRTMPKPPRLGKQIERAARALTGNALLGLLAPGEVGNRLKEAYNGAAQPDWPQFASEMERGLALYDGFDGIRGNQWLAEPAVASGRPYQALARVLADDRLWVNSISTDCTRYLAVELAALTMSRAPGNDCGGRTPNYDAVDVFRSLLVDGTITGVEDGVARDDHVHSTAAFPFLAPP